MKEELTIRVVKPEDAKGLLEIYAPYVEKTAITFEYEVSLVGTSDADTGCMLIRDDTAEAPAWLIWMAMQVPYL